MRYFLSLLFFVMVISFSCSHKKSSIMPVSFFDNTEVDWSRMETVTLNMNEYYFSPSELFLTQDTPYKLQLKNEGAIAHNFVCKEFFRDILLKKIESGDGEIIAKDLEGIEVYPGRSIEIFFVPRYKDSYNFSCTVANQLNRGMVGLVTVR